MADKDFGVKRINLVGAAGTPTITSPTDLIINANKVAISTNTTVGGSIGIGTTNPTSKLWVNGDGYFVGVVTANKFSGQLDVTSAQKQSVGFATTATNLASGDSGNIPYQSSPNTTAFVTNGTPGQVLLSNGSSTPYWGNVSEASGSFGGITVRDENEIVGTSGSITTLKFVGLNIVATASSSPNGIATITVSDNLVGTGLSISGITTIGFGNTGVVIKTENGVGIVTSSNPGVTTVTYYGNFIGTASTAGFAATAFSLNGTSEGNLNVAYAQTAGIATVATKLQTARTISLSNDLSGSVTFDGSSDVTISATIQADSVALGSDTTGDYVQSISGTSNQITVTGGTGEGSTPVISITTNPTLQGNVTITSNLDVTGNLTIGGTSSFIAANELRVKDKDIILGIATNVGGTDVSTDGTANHGGIAIASTEGTPLVDINGSVGTDTIPITYKQIMWLKSGSWTGLGTDAWLFNYGVGIGSTQFPNGTRLAAGNVQFTENDLAVVKNINATGIITATSFVGIASTAINLDGGTQGSLPYQNASGITSFLSGASVNNKILLYDLSNNKPYWGDVSGGSGAFGGITVRDEGTNPLSSITTVDIFGSNITATSGGVGIASIRVNDNLVGTGLSISGITTVGSGNTGIVINGTTGIITSISPGVTTVTFVGNLTGTASTASFATTAFSLQGFNPSTSTVGSATTATDVIGGIGSISRLSVSGITTVGSGNIGIVINGTTGIITSISPGVTTVTFVGNLTGTASTASFATTAFSLQGFSEGNLNVAYAKTAGIATHLKGGDSGNIPYQSSPNTTAFVTNGTPGQVLLSNGSSTPYWGNVSAASGSFGGITVRDEGTLVGTSGSITTLNFVGSNIVAIASSGSNGIATITVSDNLVGTGLSISGVSTFGTTNNGVVIKTENGVGIVTSSNPGVTTVTYYGDGSKLTGIGTATSATNVVLSEDISSTVTNVVFSETPDQNPTSALKSNPGLIFNASTSSLGIGNSNPSFKLDIVGDTRVQSSGKMRFGGTAGTTNFYVQYNSTTNSLDFVAG